MKLSLIILSLLFTGFASHGQSLNIEVSNTTKGTNLNYSANNKTLTVCPGDVISMVASFENTEEYTISWKILSTNEVVNSSILTSDKIGEYEARAINNSEPSIAYTAKVTINNFVTEPFAILNGNQGSVCQNDPYIINATTGKSNYFWYKINNIGDTLSTLASYRIPSVTESGHRYVASTRDANECILSDTIEISTRTRPMVNIGNDREICVNSTITLSDPNPIYSVSGSDTTYSHRWSNGNLQKTLDYSNSIAGNYTIWLRITDIQNGCSGTDTITVKVYDTPTINLSPSIPLCFGQTAQLSTTITGGKGPFTYDWTPKTNINGDNTLSPTVSPTEATTYTITVNSTTVSGCEASRSTLVQLNNEIITSTSTTAPQSAAPLCLGSSATISGEASGGDNNFTYTWKSPDLNTVISQNQEATVSPKTSSFYYFYAKDSKGCTKKDSAYVNISTLKVQLPRTDTTLCGSSSITLNAMASGGAPFTDPLPAYYNYTWEDPFNANHPNSSSITSIPIGTISTYKVKVTVTDFQGCQNSAIININLDTAAISISRAGVARPDTFYICERANSRITLSASSNITEGNWNWTGTRPIISNQNASNPVIGPGTPMATDRYIASFRNRCNIQAENDTIYVKTVPLPGNFQIELSQIVTICSGESEELKINFGGQEPDPTYTYVWRDEFDNELARDTTIYVASNRGKHYLYIYNTFSMEVRNTEGCHRRSEYTVEIYEPPTVARVDIDTTVLYCTNEPIVLNGLSDGDTLTYTWTHTGLGKFTGESEKTSYYNPIALDTGIVSFKLLIENLCGQAEDSVNLHFIKAPTAKGTASDTYVYPGQEVTFKSYSETDSLLIWSFNNGTSDMHWLETVKNSFLYPGTYPVEIIAMDKNGCMDIDTINVTVTDQQIKYIPKYFSPLSNNPDNAYLKVFGTNIVDENFEFTVYNRWGEAIYHTKSFVQANTEGWDGTHYATKTELSSGIYTWSIKLKYYDGTEDEGTGFVTLIR